MDEHEKRELANSYVNLKEHFDALWLERARNIELQFRAVADSLSETAKVLEHRLVVLNHAHEQSLEDRADFAKKENYENLKSAFEDFKLDITNGKLECSIHYDFKKDFENWKREEFGKWKEVVDRDRTTNNTRILTTVAVIGFVFVLVQIGISLWRG